MAGKNKSEKPAAATAEPNTTVSEILAANQELMERNERLVAALLGRSGEKPKAETIRVNYGGRAMVSFTVTDERGLPKHVSLEQMGQFVDLTLEEIQQVRDKMNFLFEQGFVTAEGIDLGALPNVILDMDRFLSELQYEEITPRLMEIDAVGTLYAIYNHIESKRFQSHDEKGNVLKDDEGKPVLKTVDLPPKLLLIEASVQRRIQELTGASAAMEPGE